MSAKKNLKKKVSPAPQTESTGGEFFTKEEWTHFHNEIDKQLAEGGKIIDIGKAKRNALYLSRLDRAIANIKAGRWTEHELIEVEDDE